MYDTWYTAWSYRFIYLYILHQVLTQIFTVILRWHCSCADGTKCDGYIGYRILTLTLICECVSRPAEHCNNKYLFPQAINANCKYFLLMKIRGETLSQYCDKRINETNPVTIRQYFCYIWTGTDEPIDGDKQTCE